MTESSDSHQHLEWLVHRTLRAQPLRAAPHTLEIRVLREIERRAAAQWSRLNFMRWPLIGRAAFVALCLGTAQLLVSATTWAAAHALAAVRFIPLN
jgi:hypothetical protein